MTLCSLDSVGDRSGVSERNNRIQDGNALCKAVEAKIIATLFKYNLLNVFLFSI